MITRYGCDPLPSERQDHSGATSAPLVPPEYVAEAAEAGHLPAPTFATSQDCLATALAIADALGHPEPTTVLEGMLGADRPTEPDRPLLDLIREGRENRSGR